MMISSVFIFFHNFIKLEIIEFIFTKKGKTQNAKKQRIEIAPNQNNTIVLNLILNIISFFL